VKGIVRRPKAIVLSENAIVPDENLISPAPNQFTHVLTQALPYYFTGAQQGAPPNGEFSAGTKVVLLVHDGGTYCRVANEQGLYVEVECNGLKKL
jgi:hypothetical protein